MKRELSISHLLDSGLVWSEAHSATALLGQESTALTRGATTEILSARFGVPAIDQSLPLLGLPFGRLHEFAFTHQQQEKRNALEAPLWLLSCLLAQTLQYAPIQQQLHQQQRHTIVWIGQRTWPTPHTLDSAFKTPEWSLRSLFLAAETKESRRQSIIEALRHSCVIAVIADASGIALPAYRTLQRAVRYGGALALLIRQAKEIQLPSSAYSRWLVRPEACADSLTAWSLELIKIKGALRKGHSATTPWIVYWNEEGDNGAGSLALLSSTASEVSRETRTYSAA